MKNILQTFLSGIFLLISLAGTGQQKSSSMAHITTFKVSGNCDMCKENIESALDVKGVKSAKWNGETHMLKVEFIPEKISEVRLHELVAAAGYDTEKVKASDKSYNDLPGCCQYARVGKTVVESAPPKFENALVPVAAEIMQAKSPLQTIFDSYFSIKDALVKTDGTNASVFAMKMVSQLNLLKMDSLTQDEKAAWIKVEKDLKFDAEHISETRDAGHQRDHFGSFSKNMMTLMKASKPSEKVYYQHCPMFNKGKGADWLSKESAIKNPYYGSSMLTCGKTVETIQ